MKTKILLTTLLASSFTSPILRAQDPQQQEQEQPVEQVDPNLDKAAILNTRFSNIPEEKRREYLTLRADAHRYFSNKRTFETLTALLEMRSIFKEDPVAYNLLGAIYVEFRDFPKARETFQKAVELAGEDPKVLFNLAELEFCDNQWASSIENFNILLEKIENQHNSDFARLVEFKIMLCKLALSESSDATIAEEKKKEYLAEAKQLAHKYTYLLDSPYYYYANASICFYENDNATASDWILTAKTVFANNPNLVTSWDDTLVEFGYIEAHYGKHHTEGAGDTLLTPKSDIK